MGDSPKSYDIHDDEIDGLTADQLYAGTHSYAGYLEIDLDTEEDLLWVAERALTELPDGWDVYVDDEGENAGVPYFYDNNTAESHWHHPNETRYITMVKDERRRIEKRQEREREKRRAAKKSSSPSRDATMESEKEKSEPVREPEQAMPEREPVDEVVVEDFEEMESVVSEDVPETVSLTSPKQSTSPEKPAAKAKATERQASETTSSSWAEEEQKATKSSKGSWDTAKSGGAKADDRGWEREREREREKGRTRDRERDREREREKEKGREREKERERERKIQREQDEEEARERRKESSRRGSTDKSSSGSGSSASDVRELRRLADDNERLRGEIREARSTGDDERERARDVEKRLDKKLRGLEEELEQTVRQLTTAKRESEDINESLTELKNVGTGANRELDKVRADLLKMKQKAAEADTANAELRHSIQDGQDRVREECRREMAEQQAELKREVTKYANYSSDLLALRDGNASLTAKLADASQQVQIATAEAEAAKAGAMSAGSESQVTQQALVQATQRMTVLDSELAKARAELMSARHETESLQADLRKLEGTKVHTNDRASLAEAELRRFKAKAQTDASHWASRSAELTANVQVLQEQLDRADEHESKAVREVQQAMDALAFENQRLKSRVKETETKAEMDGARILALERELSEAQDVLFKRDRLLAEEKKRTEAAITRVSDTRAKLEQELEETAAILDKERNDSADHVVAHRKEIEGIKREVSAKIPQIVAVTVKNLEEDWNKKMAYEVSVVKGRAEASVESLKRELMELQTSQVERDARSRIAMADERAELQRLRAVSSQRKMYATPAPQQAGDYGDYGDYGGGGVGGYTHTQNYDLAQTMPAHMGPGRMQGAPHTAHRFNSSMGGMGGMSEQPSAARAAMERSATAAAKQRGAEEEDARLREQAASKQQEEQMSQALSEVQGQLAAMKTQLSYSLDLNQSYAELAGAAPSDGGATTLTPTLSRVAAVAQANARPQFSVPSRALALGESPETLFTSPQGNASYLRYGYPNTQSSATMPTESETGFREGIWRERYQQGGDGARSRPDVDAAISSTVLSGVDM
jgi:hypothetical protein